tara:strand:+ start:3017 stop:3118 length:102 start_codon:yes stop_codon:yes gene_type:complete
MATIRQKKSNGWCKWTFIFFIAEVEAMKKKLSV